MKPLKHLLVSYLALILLAPFLSAGETNAPCLFGVVTDIQYADKMSRGPRKYSRSMEKLAECVQAFNAQPLDFVIELGDLMDGYQNDTNRSMANLNVVLPVLHELQAPLYYVLGNHCLTGGRDAVVSRLKLDRPFYDFTRPAAPGWRFVVLDGNEGGKGAVAQQQRDWLKTVLGQAQINGERVICFCHFPLVQEAGRGPCMKEPEKMVDLVNDYPCVAGWFCGHDHQGGYVESNGVHYVNFKGMIEASSNAYAIVELSADRLRIKGFANEPSRNLVLRTKK